MTLTLLPKRAERDIVVIKLVLKGEVKYYPWYMRFRDSPKTSYEFDKKTSITWGIKDLACLLFKRDTRSGIYSYPIDNKYLAKMEEPFRSSYIEFLRKSLPRNQGRAAIVLCVIPKGSLYYECIDSKLSYRYKMIPQLVSTSIIPKKDITDIDLKTIL